ncbi:hypothetical protein F5Y11DRAFT_364915 [Daldinia sp. FL1419]|nr:hypothetical protein F5Y11DRAFT_364915 [Daldinia sp. FL1419]
MMLRYGFRGLRHAPIDDFFAQYPEFNYDEKVPLWVEFRLLCEHYGWSKESPRRIEARRRFKEAMISEFGKLYGTNNSSLSSWQKLCRVLEISPIPEDIKSCRKDVLSVHVNLVDLVDCHRTGERVRKFPNLRELREYTQLSEKYFPAIEAKAKGPLKYLLRHILG